MSGIHLTPKEAEVAQDLQNEEDEGDDEVNLANLDALVASAKYENIKTAAYKTVAVFAGLTKRKLWLMDGTIGATNGYRITAPFASPWFYTIVEHELAHVLFQSDRVAANVFIDSYVQEICTALVRSHSPVSNVSGLKTIINDFVNVLEDERVESLWELLYPGSFMQMLELRRDSLEQLTRRGSHRESLGVYFAAVSCRPQQTDPRMDSPYARFRPIMEEALRRVRVRGFGSTLLMSKWLLTQLVSELVKEARQRPSGPSLTQPQGAGGAQAQQDPGQSQNSSQSGSSGAPGADGAAGAPVQARAEALQQLARSSSNENVVSAVAAQMADFDTDPKFMSDYARSSSENLGREMAKAAVNEAALEKTLQQSTKQVSTFVDKVKSALSKNVPRDGWLTKDAMAKVNFAEDDRAEARPRLDAEDLHWVRKLRSMFLRVQGRRKTTLHDTGSVIDVLSFIESRFAREPLPCFTAEDSGRGFKVLVLLDRSGSMSGEKTLQAERACRILLRALDFPFVDLHVWGFASRAGEVDITRYHRKAPHSGKAQKGVKGTTPLHTALKLARRHLEEGSDAKLLVTITDGYPVFTSKKGKGYSTKALLQFSRSEVRMAREHGIKISSVIIGDDLKDQQLNTLFGHRNWKRVDPKRLGDAVVHVISSGFLSYLQRG